MKEGKHRLLPILFAVILTFTTTGCGDATEVNRLAIVTTSGVDIMDRTAPNPLYNITLQIARTSLMGTSQGGGSSGRTGTTNTVVNI